MLFLDSRLGASYPIAFLTGRDDFHVVPFLFLFGTTLKSSLPGLPRPPQCPLIQPNPVLVNILTLCATPGTQKKRCGPWSPMEWSCRTHERVQICLSSLRPAYHCRPDGARCSAAAAPGNKAQAISSTSLRRTCRDIMRLPDSSRQAIWTGCWKRAIMRRACGCPAVSARNGRRRIANRAIRRASQ